MPHRLPSLDALRVFEAAARHLSFTQAADELNVTQAAVSQRIRSLEESLGVPLFKQCCNRSSFCEGGSSRDRRCQDSHR